MHTSLARYPTLTASVPIYNYIIDKLEDFQDQPGQDQNLKTAAELAINKLRQYYPKTEGLVYVVATS